MAKVKKRNVIKKIGGALKKSGIIKSGGTGGLLKGVTKGDKIKGGIGPIIRDVAGKAI